MSAEPVAPILFGRDDFYLVRSATGEPKAFYVYAQFSQLHERPDCPVSWWDQSPVGGSEGVFCDPCFGATFTHEGDWVSGPSSRGLDHFSVQVKDGRILVDTRKLLCDGPGDCRRL